MQSFAKVTHCIFDMDGLLLDTETNYTKIAQKILEECGSTEIYTHEMKVQLMGLQIDEAAKSIVDHYNLPITADDFVRRNREIAIEWMPHVGLMAGADRLLRHLHAKDIPIALATSSGKEMFDVKTVRHLELFDLLHHKVYGSSDADVVNGKPAPDIFLVCAKRFDDSPNPGNCLVFEDSPNGIKAACAAGMQSVMVPENYVSEKLREGSTIVIDSLADFKPEMFGLPPFEDSMVY